jgi:D-alanyl-D-alanine dipeptidase
MGTKYLEINDKTFTKSKKISPEENKNRRILSDAMQKAGFANYPAEWWHFSYGDRLWAAYSGRKLCAYGIQNLPV